LDVTFVVDSTGSMGEVLGWLKRDVLQMMKAFGLISREPRIGVVAYRDHGDDYLVKPLWLTGNGKKLIEFVNGLQAAGGGEGDVPEAVCEGLEVALLGQAWSEGPRALKVIVLLGDAPPHEPSMPRLKELVQQAAQKRFRVFPMKIKTRYGGSANLASFDRIAEWAGTRALWLPLGGQDPNVSGKFTKGPSNAVVEEVVRGIVSAEYHDRVEPFVNVLLEYVEGPVKEHRRPFSPPRPSPPRPPSPPRDPQSRDPQRR
jgi:hypothetical protein